MASYNQFAEQYHNMVKSGGPDNSYRYILQQLQQNSSDLNHARILDIGCGPGELSYRISLQGAGVTGIDLSYKLLEYARERSDQVTWIQDDAMHLHHIQDSTYDFVVSSVMLMDVPDHRAVFNSAYRVLKPNGIMIWVIMHPCFQSPFSHPLGDGSRKVMQYEAQFWKSEGVGTIRSTLGAYHRTLSQYLNDFMTSGFSLLRVDEPERDNKTVDGLPSLFAAVGRKI